MAGAAIAQPPGGGGGGFQPTPEMQAAFKKMGAWRENHKNISQLSQTMRAVTEFDKDPALKLTKDQAKKIAAVVKPWQTKPVMTDEQALALNKQITGAFSIPQIKKMATLASQRGGFGGGGGRPGGGGGGFGGGGQGGGRPGGGGAGGGRTFDPSKMQMKEYNPLNINSYPDFMKQRAGKRVTDFYAVLQSRAA